MRKTWEFKWKIQLRKPPKIDRLLHPYAGLFQLNIWKHMCWIPEFWNIRTVHWGYHFPLAFFNTYMVGRYHTGNTSAHWIWPLKRAKNYHFSYSYENLPKFASFWIFRAERTGDFKESVCFVQWDWQIFPSLHLLNRPYCLIPVRILTTVFILNSPTLQDILVSGICFASPFIFCPSKDLGLIKNARGRVRIFDVSRKIK